MEGRRTKRKAVTVPVEAPTSEGRAFIVAFAKRVHRYATSTFENGYTFNTEYQRLEDLKRQYLSGIVTYLHTILPKYDWDLEEWSYRKHGYEHLELSIVCHMYCWVNPDQIHLGTIFFALHDLVMYDMGIESAEDIISEKDKPYIHENSTVHEQYAELKPVLEKIRSMPVSFFTSLAEK